MIGYAKYTLKVISKSKSKSKNTLKVIRQCLLRSLIKIC